MPIHNSAYCAEPKLAKLAHVVGGIRWQICLSLWLKPKNTCLREFNSDIYIYVNIFLLIRCSFLWHVAAQPDATLEYSATLIKLPVCYRCSRQNSCCLLCSTFFLTLIDPWLLLLVSFSPHSLPPSNHIVYKFLTKPVEKVRIAKIHLPSVLTPKPLAARFTLTHLQLAVKQSLRDTLVVHFANMTNPTDSIQIKQ